MIPASCETCGDPIQQAARCRRPRRYCDGCGPPAKRPEYRRAYYENNRAAEIERARRSHIRLKFGLTLEQYTALLEEPCGVCGGESTALDHDHATGEVRAGLCDHCNRGLGCFRDDPERLRAAAAYLERFS